MTDIWIDVAVRQVGDISSEKNTGRWVADIMVVNKKMKRTENKTLMNKRWVDFVESQDKKRKVFRS